MGKQSQKTQWVDLMDWQIKSMELPPPDHEVKFHPVRKWRFDLGWPTAKIALEVHGGVYSNGRHTRGAGFTEDRRKMNEAILLGWRVFEVTPEMIENGEAAHLIERALKINPLVV